MFDLVPFRSASRDLAERDCQPVFRGQRCLFARPHSAAVAGGAARLDDDQQSRNVRIAEAAALRLLVADRVDGAHGRVVVGTEADPPVVAGDFVDRCRMANCATPRALHNRSRFFGVRAEMPLTRGGAAALTRCVRPKRQQWLQEGDSSD